MDIIDQTPFTGDKFAEIKNRLRRIGYSGPFHIDMLIMGAALLKYRKIR